MAASTIRIRQRRAGNVAPPRVMKWRTSGLRLRGHEAERIARGIVTAARRFIANRSLLPPNFFALLAGESRAEDVGRKRKWKLTQTSS
jgi:hypothetical protein